MVGLVIWAHSYCRSTLGFFKELGKSFNVPLKVCIWKINAKLRTNVGFTEDEFNDMDITFIGDDYNLARTILLEHKSANHLFGAYQAVELYQRLILEAKNIGCKIAIASEAPCNMNIGLRRFQKDIYIKYILPIKVKKQIQAADFIINFSGDDEQSLVKIGWPKEKIIPCGYYSPRILNTHLIKRDENNWNSFNILLTGIHQWHRSPMLLLQALKVLKDYGLSPICNITQDGPLLSQMKKFVLDNNLNNVHFLGFVSMKILCHLYETCSLYIGTGNYEPWGMRLNDALQCGAPLIVNEGMGGAKLVNDYGCGITFKKNDYRSLASVLTKLITNKNEYLKVADAAFYACKYITPESKAKEIAKIIQTKFKGW